MATSDHTNPQPKRLDIAVEEIAATLVDLLSSENVRAGMRLRSVRDLADIFGTDFWRVHRAIQQLTERGILAKRHGSGTFVRRVPVAADGGKRSPLFRKLKAKQILSSDDGVRTRRRPLAQHRHLDFQIWTDIFWDSPVHKSILQGVADVLTPLGHRVTTCGGLDATGAHLDKKQVEKKLQAHPADGYLVLDWVADSYAEQFNATGKLWLTFGFSGPLRHQPGMILDCMEAAERGTRALIEGGCRRVALLGFFTEDRDCDFERYYYMHALRCAGINDYQVAEFVPLDATKVRRALAGMLDSPHPPDGLYVADDNLLPLVAKELERGGIWGWRLSGMRISRSIAPTNGAAWNTRPSNSDERSPKTSSPPRSRPMHGLAAILPLQIGRMGKPTCGRRKNGGHGKQSELPAPKK